MSILSHQSIETRAGGPSPLIDPFEDGNCRSAGYDLRAGGGYYLAHTCDPKGEVEFGELSETAGPLEIGRNQVALIAVRERLLMPKDLVGHITLKMDLLLRGIIMASQSQIDAGYEGNLTILLYNLSQRSVLINWNQSIVRVEFALLDQSTDRPYGASDTFQNLPLRQAVREPIDSSLRDMEDRINAAETTVRQTARRDLIGGLVLAGTVLLSILTVILVVVALLSPIQQEASNAQAAAGGASHLRSELAQAKAAEMRLQHENAQVSIELKKAKAAAKQLQQDLNQDKGMAGAAAWRSGQVAQVLLASLLRDKQKAAPLSQPTGTVIRR